jgi:hypothetical protein
LVGGYSFRWMLCSSFSLTGTILLDDWFTFPLLEWSIYTCLLGMIGWPALLVLDWIGLDWPMACTGDWTIERCCSLEWWLTYGASLEYWNNRRCTDWTTDWMNFCSLERTNQRTNERTDGRTNIWLDISIWTRRCEQYHIGYGLRGQTVLTDILIDGFYMERTATMDSNDEQQEEQPTGWTQDIWKDSTKSAQPWSTMDRHVIMTARQQTRISWLYFYLLHWLRYSVEHGLYGTDLVWHPWNTDTLVI